MHHKQSSLSRARKQSLNPLFPKMRMPRSLLTAIASGLPKTEVRCDNLPKLSSPLEGTGVFGRRKLETLKLEISHHWIDCHIALS